MATRQQLLQYIENTQGNATLKDFMEDWEPIGAMCFTDLDKAGFVIVTDMKLTLSDLGKDTLKRLKETNNA